MCGSCCVCNCVSLLSPAMQSAVGNIHGGLCPTKASPGPSWWEDAALGHRPVGKVCGAGCTEGCGEDAQGSTGRCAGDAQRLCRGMHRGMCRKCTEVAQGMHTGMHRGCTVVAQRGGHRGCTEGCTEGYTEDAQRVAQRMHRGCTEDAQRDAQRVAQGMHRGCTEGCTEDAQRDGGMYNSPSLLSPHIAGPAPG